MFNLLLAIVCSQTPAVPEPLLANDLFGVCIADAGDLDGDGLHDVWVGDPSRRERQDDSFGKAWAISTRDGATILRIDSPADARGFGWSLATLGDTDGDGIGDVAVSCLRIARADEHEDFVGPQDIVPSGEGAVYVHSGRDGSLRFAVHGPADSVKFPGSTTAGGPALTSVGDWDEDAVDDLAIGWSFGGDELRAAGLVEVVSGHDGTRIHAWSGVEAHDTLGFSLLALPDLDGDGKRELAAGAVEYDGFSLGQDTLLAQRSRSGYVQILSAKGHVLRTLHPLDGSRSFGFGLATIPTLSPSAIEAELLVGQPYSRYSPHSRLAITRWSLVDGTPTRLLTHPPSYGWGEWERWRPEGSFGTCILTVPDRGGDGLADVLVTEPQAFCYFPARVLSSEGGSGQGLSVAIRLLGQLALGDLAHDFSHVGIGLCAIGDLDGDDFEDFALSGASLRCGSTCFGSVVLVSGKTLTVLRAFTRRGRA